MNNERNDPYRSIEISSNASTSGTATSSAGGVGAMGGGGIPSCSGSTLSVVPAATVASAIVPSDSDSDVNDCDDDDEAFLACDDDLTASLAAGLSHPGNKSPTQSVRSLLSRPRSTPMRRATISGSSPSLSRPYINISEVVYLICLMSTV